jgi:anti-anti-sigma regulatory factor
MSYFDLEEYGDFSVLRFFVTSLTFGHTVELNRQLENLKGKVSGDIILDMSEVKTMETPVVSVLKSNARRCKEEGIKCAMACMQPDVARVYAESDLSADLPAYSSLDEAFEKLPQGKESSLKHIDVAPDGHMLCPRNDCLFNQRIGMGKNSCICIHEYANLIGNPMSCRYFRLNWAAVSEETEELVEERTDQEKKDATKPPETVLQKYAKMRDSKQLPPKPVPSSPPPPPPEPVHPEPAIPPSAIVKKFIESSNDFDFDEESKCLTDEYRGASLQEYMEKRKEIYSKLSKLGPPPQFFFRGLNDETIEGDKATVDCMRTEVDATGRHELRQVFELVNEGGKWKIISITSGGRLPRRKRKPPIIPGLGKTEGKS